jgi:hypothetical protein
MNGAGSGTDPQKDMVVSNVSGAVLRSTNTGVFIQDLAVVPFSASTTAYDFQIVQELNFVILFGSSVVEIVPL